MFKTICNTISICLEGTIFRRKAKKGLLAKDQEVLWALEGVSRCAPYVLTQEEYMIRNDLITRLHTTDNGLVDAREESRRGKAKWFRDLHEQTYDPAIRAPISHPQAEVYYRNLSHGLTRDPRITLTSVNAR